MKKRNKVLALLLFAVLFLTSCGAKEETPTEPDKTIQYTQSSSSSSSSTTKQSSQEELTSTTEAKPRKNSNIITSDGLALTDEERKLYDKSFKVSTKAWENCLDKIGNIDIAYDYENYFNIPDHTDLSYTPSVKAGTIIRNKTVDPTALEEYVLRNNAEYLKEKGQGIYGETTSSAVSQMCRDIAKEMNYYLAKADVDLDLLEEKLQGLKVFVYSGYGKGVYIADEGIMQINKENLNDQKTLSHETVHAIQAASKQEIAAKGYVKRLGYCYQTSKEKVNPYNYLWLIEGSAERLGTVDYLKQSKPSIYEKWCDALTDLKQACFDGGFDLEMTTFCRDINVLHQYLAAQKPNAKNNIQKMLYATEILLDPSASDEIRYFYNSLGDQSFQFDYYKQKSVFSMLSCSVAITKAQIFYSKLAQKTADKPMTLSELFSVVSSFENNINLSVFYQSGNDGVDHYLNEYCLIQQIFFEALAKSLGVSTKTMIALYSSYYHDVQQYSRVGWLSDAENRLFEVQYQNGKRTARDVLCQN